MSSTIKRVACKRGKRSNSQPNNTHKYHPMATTIQPVKTRLFTGDIRSAGSVGSGRNMAASVRTVEVGFACGIFFLGAIICRESKGVRE